MAEFLRQNHRCGNHWTGERAAADFIDTGDRIEAARITIRFEPAKPR